MLFPISQLFTFYRNNFLYIPYHERIFVSCFIPKSKVLQMSVFFGICLILRFSFHWELQLDIRFLILINILDIILGSFIVAEAPFLINRTVGKPMANKYHCISFWHRHTNCLNTSVYFRQVNERHAWNMSIIGMRDRMEAWRLTEIPLKQCSEEYTVNISSYKYVIHSCNPRMTLIFLPYPWLTSGVHIIFQLFS